MGVGVGCGGVHSGGWCNEEIFIRRLMWSQPSVLPFSLRFISSDSFHPNSRCDLDSSLCSVSIRSVGEKKEKKKKKKKQMRG